MLICRIITKELALAPTPTNIHMNAKTRQDGWLPYSLKCIVQESGAFGQDSA